LDTNASPFARTRCDRLVTERRSSPSLAGSAGGRLSLAASSNSRGKARALGRSSRARVARGLFSMRNPIFWPLPIRGGAA